MPEEEVEDEEIGTVTDAVASAKDALTELQSLFATLVPPDKIEIEDALGNKYNVRARLPARSQIVILGHIESLMEVVVPQSVSESDAITRDLATMLIGLAKDEKVLDGLCEAFGYAHPNTVKAAHKAAAADAKGGGYGIDSDHPADLFGVEDIVAGLVPFLIRFASRAANLVSQVTGPKA